VTFPDRRQGRRRDLLGIKADRRQDAPIGDDRGNIRLQGLRRPVDRCPAGGVDVADPRDRLEELGELPR
jgi:hypothetical protein